MKTIAEVLEQAGSKPVSFETLLEETGLTEIEVDESLGQALVAFIIMVCFNYAGVFASEGSWTGVVVGDAFGLLFLLFMIDAIRDKVSR